MAYSKEQLRNIFQNKFDREAWKAIVVNIFGANKVRRENELFTDPDDAEVGYYMGSIDTSDHFRIGLFYYKINSGSVAHKKVGLRNLVKKFINQNWGEFDAAIVVFDDNKDWRLSFVCDIKEEATAPKRFTFVFGEKDNFYRTAIDRFDYLQTHGASFENIRKAFSVDALSDDFFDEYRELYADFVEYITGKRYVKESNKWVERVIDKPNYQYESTFGKDDKLVRDYIKKMFGRIVFLYFLQRKGWLDGNRQYMHDLFYNSNKKDNFLDGVLEPLFFEVLNTDKPYRTEAAKALPGSDNIPYLNGGLFARDEIDERTCIFKEEDFERLFDFLDSYNFTIDENDTDDAEIGIDPEMLGRIFENLLEDNKDKGAFYTPKEIVDYMCRESIIAYLQNGIPERSHELIRNFVETFDASLLDEKQRLFIRKKLQAVKICDPAIGSGAFPMGLVNLLSKIYVAMKSDTDTAKMKRHIMEQNIYGVDIEQGAVDIARLRFWLAMIVEEKEPMPLPNLHFKIMQGNSLLESYNGIDLSDLTKLSKDLKYGESRGLWDTEDSEREALISSLKSYYKTSDHSKRDRLFNDIINNVRRQLLDKNIILPAGKDPSANTDFFLWHTWFSDVFANGGFDIVIGNPPYVLLQNTPMSTTDKETLTSIYKVAQYKVDLYHLFIERGCNLLTNGGVLIYINPTNFLTNNYTSKLRKFILTEYSLNSVVNITTNVFEASVNTGIFTISNSNEHKTVSYSSGVLENGSLVISEMSYSDRSNYNEKNNYIIQPLVNNNSIDLISKIENIGCVIKDIASVSFGMQLRNRKIFTEDVIENPNENQLTEFHRPCLTGKDINFFTSKFANRFCYFNRIAKCGGCWDETLHNTPIKVLVRQVGSVPVCGIDTNGYAILNSAFMIVPNNYDAFCLMGLINSKVIRYYWNIKFEDKRKTFPKIKGTYLEQIPIPSISNKDVADCALAINNAIESGDDARELLDRLDYLVYKLYGLSFDEIQVIDPETSLTREKYEGGK